MIIVRDARPEDITAIYGLVRACDAERPPPKCTFDEAKVWQQLDHLINSPAAFARIAARPDEMIGVMLADIGEVWFSSDFLIQNYLFYVLPEHRGGSAAARLFTDFMAWRDIQPVAGTYFIVEAGINDEVCGSMLLKAGFRRNGTVYTDGAA